MTMNSMCNQGCSGNTYNYVEYCGSNSYISVYIIANFTTNQTIFYDQCKLLHIFNTLGFRLTQANCAKQKQGNHSILPQTNDHKLSSLTFFLANAGCYPSNQQYWDLFSNGLSQSLIQSSEWNTNIWQPINGISNWYAWKSSMTVAQCENYCKTKGFLLAGLANGQNNII